MTRPPTQAGNKPAYKRSWKNLLINKRYQLRFTLFMVGLSTLLIGGLGLWVMMVANDATEVAKADVLGTQCIEVTAFEGVDPIDTGAVTPSNDPDVPMKLGDTVPVPPVPDEDVADGSDAGSGTDEPQRRKIDVVLDDMTMAPPPPPKVKGNLKAQIIEHHMCRMSIPASLDKLDRGRLQILLVLIASGLILVFGLAVYGIKMTHKVAGPLFKVGLYLAKMRDGRFDKVYNLRKGDQLVNFYDHFKEAHAGVVKMQKDDIDRLKAVIVAAEAAGAGEDATVNELRELVARKEKALE